MDSSLRPDDDDDDGVGVVVMIALFFAGVITSRTRVAESRSVGINGLERPNSRRCRLRIVRSSKMYNIN